MGALRRVCAGPPPGSCIVPSSEPSNRIFLFSRKHSRSSSHVQRVSYFWIDATQVQILIDGATLIASREASMANYQPRCLSRTLSPFPYRRYIRIQWACQLPYSICKVRFCENRRGSQFAKWMSGSCSHSPAAAGRDSANTTQRANLKTLTSPFIAMELPFTNTAK